VAGIGADAPGSAYPDWLEQRLDTDVLAYGLPGDTAEEGLLRLLRTAEIRGGIVVVTLGGNDILRKVPWETTRESLGALFQELQARGCLVAFTSLHPMFDGSRSADYRRLCRDFGVILVPDVLADIIDRPALRTDPIHPNEEGYRIFADHVADVIRPHLRK
jgi:lysophospholipase L1-like esterase